MIGADNRECGFRTLRPAKRNRFAQFGQFGVHMPSEQGKSFVLFGIVRGSLRDLVESDGNFLNRLAIRRKIGLIVRQQKPALPRLRILKLRKQFVQRNDCHMRAYDFLAAIA